MRENWLIHLCTDWMGDDAWLWKLDCEFRAFNFVGDTQWLSGRVVRAYRADGGRPAADLEIACVNQRGVTTTPGHATVPVAEPRTRARPSSRPTGRSDEPDRRVDRDLRGVLPPMTYASVPGLRVALDGPVLRVTLDRVEQRNAIDDVMMDALVDVFTRVGTDEQVRAVRLGAAGDHFCSGADLIARQRG